jgi:hypothetical protein
MGELYTNSIFKKIAFDTILTGINHGKVCWDSGDEA